MRKLLKSKRAEGYIDVVVTVLCSMMVIVLAINTFSFLKLKQDMNYMSKELLTTASTDGQIYYNTDQRLTELKEETGINVSVAWNTTFYNTYYGTVQLGEKIELTITCQTTFKGLGGLFDIPVTLKTKQSALSQKYWK